MNRLFTLHRQPDLLFEGTVLRRKAYRAIIYEQGRLLMIRSAKYGEIKFPGGGKQGHERAFDVLSREVAEETGRRIRRRIIPFGETMEYARDFEGKYDIFQQESRYYFCTLRPETVPIRLEDYEIEYGYSPCWVTPEEAWEHNRSLTPNDRIPWKERDTEVLRILMERRVNP
ncbi:MAG TPA: NUDIX domain-containing protein [Candidatus Izemoplasmatales bacterium]|nr:NUDIX domain-containing protein [Candidatus Izemoplasmatales bacterium]